MEQTTNPSDGKGVLFAEIAAVGLAVLSLIGIEVGLLARRSSQRPDVAPVPPLAVSVHASTLGPPALFGTPEEVFEAAKKAVVARDHAAWFRLLTPESQERMAGEMALIGAAVFPRGPKVLEKHGVDESLCRVPLELLLIDDDDAGAAEIQKRIRQLGAAVRDKPTFYADVLSCFSGQEEDRAKTTDGTPGLHQRLAEARKSEADARLVNVEIDGDNATGILERSERGETTPSRVHFKRLDGGWYLVPPRVRLRFGTSTESAEVQPSQAATQQRHDAKSAAVSR